MELKIWALGRLTMKILENPNPAKSMVHVCEKCQCKFEFTSQDVKVKASSDANGRIGGTHYYSRQVSVNCPNCGESYILENKSGYSSSCINHMNSDDEVESRFKELLGMEG